MRQAINTRLERERSTIRTMIEIWCKGNHNRQIKDCPECSALFSYAINRIARCPFQEEKPTCAQCTVHCYNKSMRHEIRQVMRYAGPRMMVLHPILTIKHYTDEFLHRKKSNY